MNFSHIMGEQTIRKIRKLKNIKLNSMHQYKRLLIELGNLMPALLRFTLLLIVFVEIIRVVLFGF